MKIIIIMFIKNDGIIYIIVFAIVLIRTQSPLKQHSYVIGIVFAKL